MKKKSRKNGKKTIKRVTIQTRNRRKFAKAYKKPPLTREIKIVAGIWRANKNEA